MATTTLQKTAFLEAISKHDASATAVVHSLSGRSFTYGSLLQDVAARKTQIEKDGGEGENGIKGERVAFLIENSYDYVGTRPPIPQNNQSLRRLAAMNRR